MLYWRDDEIGEGDNDGGSGGVGEDDIYNNSRKKLVLVLLSDLYLELEVISISVSGLSSCSILHCLLTTQTTNYCSKKTVNNFDLRRSFYSK